MNTYTREQIKQRMLKRISLLWDIEDTQQIDPIVSLLSEAMAEEIFMLSGEMNELDDRLVSKLSYSLTPVSQLTARPSHGILSAVPVEPTFTINSDTVFTCKDSKSLRKLEIRQMSLIPVAPFTLLRAKLRYLNICGQIYECGEGFRKHSVAYADRTSTWFRNSIWLGIDADESLYDLGGLTFYLDFTNVENKYQYLQLLKYTCWSCNGKPIEIRSGLPAENTETTPAYAQSAVESILSELRVMYDIHYLSLCPHTAARSCFPAELEELYTDEVKARFTEPLFWLRVDFPDSVYRATLEGIRMGVNCFPVANISKKRISEKMTDVPLFLPLETNKNEYFIETASVEDTSGRKYHPLASEAEVSDKSTQGRYILRKGGVERYSSTNDVRSSAVRLTDILRDRNLFSSNREEGKFNELVAKTVKTVNELAVVLESSGEIAPTLSYLITERSYAGETLFADYLITNGAAINKLKFDASFEANSETGLETNKIWLVTPLRGGEDEPSIDRIRDRHRYLLTSQNRIITRQDMINFCMAEYGVHIQSVDMKAGYAISKKTTEGLVQTKDITIVLKSDSALKSDLEQMKTDLLCKLERRSIEGLHYQLFIH